MYGGFFSDRVHIAIELFFDFNVGACTVVVGKGFGNRDGRESCESQVNGMIQCLAQNVAGGAVADESDGASQQGGWSCW